VNGIENSSADNSALASSRRLVRNVLWNGAGEAGPLVAALIAMPILVHQLGTARFGVIALAWTVFAYFSLFDGGLGTALTKLISDRLATARDDEVRDLFWTCLAIMAALGVIGSLTFAALCPVLVNVLRVPAALHHETLLAFYVLAAGLPIGMMVTPLSGTLAAYQRFDLINAVRSPNTMWSSLAPLMVLPFSHNIVPIVSVLLLGHAVTAVIYFAFCRREIGGSWREIRLRRSLVPALMGFGGWVTMSNVALLIMHTIDRFALSVMVSVASVAFYVVPYRVLHKLRGVHGLIRSVLYPALAFRFAEERARGIALFERGAKAVLVLVFPVALLMVTFGGNALALWMGADFARHSATILRVLAIAALLDAVAQLTTLMYGAAHRPDLVAKMRAIEMPVYLAVLVVLIRLRGAEGAALAAALLAGCDAFALLLFARSYLPGFAPVANSTMWMLGGATACLLLAMVPSGLPQRIATVAIMFAVFAPLMWLVLMTEEDRAFVRSYLHRPRWAAVFVPGGGR
jgi:O-antigen/teichoic acid export membrane protein